ncbi:MAG: succinate dehydrogenase, hydrophobic membrane anchor protein [Chromatiales bacterium]|nr:succinate dehydrogenase, hydrophobic membrane anchor protein [Chromatiales bacterium]
MSLRTPLARAKGLGSAHEGVGHWWVQRVTAVALVPLVLWMVWSLIGLIGADYAAVRDWMRHPINGGLLVVLLLILFHHAALGLQVVIEDYLHAEGVKLFVMAVAKFAMYLLAAICVFSVLLVALGG